MGRMKEGITAEQVAFQGYTNRRGDAGEIINEYVYVDERGEPYLRVERTKNKVFLQAHWVRSIKHIQGGYWKYGQPKGPKIPYMLPDLIAAKPEEPIWIAEGEKDAESLLEFAVISTCNAGGAGKWTTDLNKWFDGKKKVAYILEDNDRAGRAHAQKVARNLVNIVEEVRIITFRDLPEHSDVTDWIEKHDGTKEQLLERAATAKPYKGLSTIQIFKGQPARAQDDTEAALIDAGQPVFVRAGTLVQPIWSELPTSGDGKTKVTVLRPLTVSNLAYMTTKHAATFVKFDRREEKLVPIDPPPAILQGLIERGHWRFPRVAGVINAPSLRPDGSILDQPGYDPATQLWCWPDDNLKLPKLTDKPTRDEALAALKLLKELLAGFPFVNVDLDRSVALAATLTAVLRAAFDVAPMFLFLAHAAGTGKSYLVNVISNIVRGRPCPVITVSRSTEEMEKRLGALLLEGPPMISLDNCTVNLEGELLCQITEQPLVKVRILGKSETPECEWRGTLFATGNNVTFAGDMTRRGLICNLDAGIELPETRRFEFDPVERVQADRGAYIAAAITIARAYLVSGDKAKCPPLGSYGGWSKFVREPLAWLGEPDPVASLEQVRADDPERNAARALVELWVKYLKADGGYTVGELIHSATETKQVGLDYERVRADLHALLIEKCPGPKGIDAKALGKWLSRMKGQVHDGYRIVAATTSKGHGNRWALMKIAETEAGGSGVEGGWFSPLL